MKNSRFSDYEEYGYDLSSQVTSTRKRSGVVIGTPRDALGRVTLEDVPATAEDVYFAYDNQGRVLSARFGSPSGSGTVQTYDGLGRMDTRAVFGRQLSYQYDLRGRRTRLTHPDGFYVSYGYSNADELTTLTDSTGTTVATYGYDATGNRTSLSRPNGTSTAFLPDAAGRLGQLTQDLSGSGFDLTATFAYNPAGQTSSKTVSNDAAYTWTPSPLTSTTSAQFDGQNQLTSFAGAAVADDANGNLWTGLGSAYTYDALGQLRQASGGPSTALVDYDPAGMLRRVQVGSATTEFLYDGGDLVAEYDGSGTVLRRFVHGAGDDEPLVAYEGSGTTNRTWLHADERGSIVAASNASGAAAASAKYTADGDSGVLASPFGYTGQLYLPELQLYYYKARMYSAKAGRFLQPDPIGYDGGMNVYGYAGNDPVNATDPSGLCEWWVYSPVMKTWVTTLDDGSTNSRPYVEFEYTCGWNPDPTGYTRSQDNSSGSVAPSSRPTSEPRQAQLQDTDDCHHDLARAGFRVPNFETGPGEAAARGGLAFLNDPDICDETKQKVALTGLGVMTAATGSSIWAGLPLKTKQELVFLYLRIVGTKGGGTPRPPPPRIPEPPGLEQPAPSAPPPPWYLPIKP